MTKENLIKQNIIEGKTSLGIEFGSTRIKAVLIGEDHSPIASGSHNWENKLEDGIWTYHLDDVWTGLQSSYAKLAEDVQNKYATLTKVGPWFIWYDAWILVFDKGKINWYPSYWRNTITEEAASILTEKFQFNIPQRWNIAHLYQAILNKEDHVKDIAFLTTLAGYVHWKLTGEKILGVGEASGVFPIDSTKIDYNKKMMEEFDQMIAHLSFDWKLRDILPEVRNAGESGGVLTEEGARLIDPTGKLEAGILYVRQKVTREPV